MFAWLRRWLRQDLDCLKPCQDCGQELATWRLLRYDQLVCDQCKEKRDMTNEEPTSPEPTLSGDYIAFGGNPIRGRVSDIFKDGPTPELTARMSVEELAEAISPDPCCECGHRHEPDFEIIPHCADEAREAVDALPEGPFRDEMEGRLRELLCGSGGEPCLVVPAGALDGISSMPAGEIVAADQVKTATWLAEHNKQLGAWINSLLENAAEALSHLEQLQSLSSPAVREGCIEDAKAALLRGLEGGNG